LQYHHGYWQQGARKVTADEFLSAAKAASHCYQVLILIYCQRGSAKRWTACLTLQQIIGAAVSCHLASITAQQLRAIASHHRPWQLSPSAEAAAAPAVSGAWESELPLQQLQKHKW
jgi:hypothetical protein